MKYAVMLLSVYKAICDKIRELLGLTDTIKADEISDKVDEVYEKGKHTEWNEFWDNFQQNGTRTNYESAFYSAGWNDNTFNPKYDIVLKDTTLAADRLFMYSKITDLKGILERNGVNVDFSKAQRLNNCFQNSTTTTIPDIDMSNCKSTMLTFYGTPIKSINIKNLREDCTFDRTFGSTNSLTNLSITGIIGENGIDLRWGALTHDSLMNVINCLMAYIIADNMDIPSDQTVTLMSNAKLIEGKNYKVFYNDDGGYGWQLQNGYTKVCEKMTVNGTETLGIKYEVMHPAGAEYEWYIIVYQDGNDIKLTVNDAGNMGQYRLVSLAVDQNATHSVTLGEANLNKLTDDEKAIAIRKGWMLN